MEYTFKNNIGLEVIVTADSEDEARAKAMTKLWGPAPDPDLGIKKYHGRGLDLVALR